MLCNRYIVPVLPFLHCHQTGPFFMADQTPYSTLQLRNPHSVLETLHQRPEDVLEIQASKQSNDAWNRVIEVARSNGIRIHQPMPMRNRNRGSRDGGRTGGNVATIRAKQGVTLEELFASDNNSGLWLALDCLQDPHNVGAVFRTAAFFGVQGIVVTVDRSAPLSDVVYDVASGGMEHVPFTLQVNLAQALEKAKKSDLWVLGTSERASQDVRQVKADRKWMLVVGNEEKGLRRLTLDRCDDTCAIPPVGPVGSLNVSVATGIMIASLTHNAVD